MERPLHILPLSAPTEESLNQLLENYKDYLQNTTESFQNIAYSTKINANSALFDHRVVIIAKDNLSALKVIKEKAYLSTKIPPQSEHQNKPKLCMLFPGQGSQYPGMAEQLYSSSSFFKCHFDQCCKILDEECNSQMDLKEILWNSTGSGSCAQLNTSINSQIAIFCVNYCLFKLWTSWGVTPDYVLGHSLGESAAVVAVGVRDLRNGLKALLLRTKRIDNLGSGKMIAVKADKVTVEKMINNFYSSEPNENYWLDIAALNSPEQTVLSGECDTVQDFYKFCRAAGVLCVIIASTHAFHSRMLDPAMEHIRKGLITIKSEFSENTTNGSSIKYISSSEARIVEREELSDEYYWVANTRNTVRFAEACQVALQEGCQIFIEVGPQSVLSTLIKVNFCGGKNVGELTCLPSLSRNGNDWETLLNSLASYWLTTRGSEIDWNGFDKPYQTNRTKIVLPFNPFISKLDVSAFMKLDYPLIGKCTGDTGDLVQFQNELDPNLFDFGEGTFLATCIAAAVALNQNDGSKGKLGMIKDFRIVQIDKFSNAGLKTIRILTKVETSTCNIKVFRAINNSSGIMDNEWIEHCSATYENNMNNGNNPSYYYLNLELRKDKWEKRMIEKTKNLMRDFTGLHFQNIWIDQHETGNKSFLISFQVKPSELPGKSCENYPFIHPVIISAMIKLTTLLQRENLFAFELGSNAIINTCVKTFCILDKLKTSTHEHGVELELYLFLRVFDDENEQPANFSVWLINSKGRALALMEGMTM